MRTLNLSGFKTGDSLSISVSQNALTAGPINVPSWGGGGGGGAPVITTKRAPVYQIAPESILFRIDHTNSTFDSPGPEAEGRYDARAHDILYFWDFGDPGTWTAPERYLPGRNNSNLMIGHVAAHIFKNPGDFTVTCFMVEPSSGKTATATLPVTVLDPDILYSGAGLYNTTLDATVVGETALINPNGDTDFSEGLALYPGALTIELDEPGFIDTLESYSYTGNNGDPVATKKSCDRWSGMQSGSPSGASGYQPRRYLFKRDGIYKIKLGLNTWDDCDVIFGAYGSGVNPIFNLAPGTFGQPLPKMLAWNDGFAGGVGRHGTPPEIRFQNIDMIHTFDPSTQDVNVFGEWNAQAIWPVSDFYVVLSDCKIKGWGSCSTYYSSSDGHKSHLHYDNTTVEDYGGQYTIMSAGSRHTDSCNILTGCKVKQNPNAIMAAWNPPETGTRYVGGYRSVVRFGMQNQVVYGCDFFHVMKGFAILKLADTPTSDGTDVNFSCNVGEGGEFFASLNSNLLGNDSIDLNRPFVNNAVFDSNVYVSSYTSDAAFYISGTGATVRNNLFVQPATPRIGDGLYGFVRVHDNVVDTGDTSPAYVLSSPIRVYNNTMYSARSHAQGGDVWAPQIIYQNTANNNYTNVAESNNVMHFPNYAGAPGGAVTTFAPLSANVLFPTYNIGHREPGVYTEAPAVPGVSAASALDTSYATPANSAIDVRPLAGSIAIGTALTGSVSSYDISGTERPDPPSKGAWEVA